MQEDLKRTKNNLKLALNLIKKIEVCEECMEFKKHRGYAKQLKKEATEAFKKVMAKLVDDAVNNLDIKLATVN